MLYSLQKLCNFGISGSMLNWSKDYLSEREPRVVIEGQSSTWSVVPSCVPQGSLLGRLLFVIFISDLPDVVIPGNTIALYAGECKGFRMITCPSDQCEFQSDLDNLYARSQQNLHSFVRSFVRSLARSFVRSFIHSFLPLTTITTTVNRNL